MIVVQSESRVSKHLLVSAYILHQKKRTLGMAELVEAAVLLHGKYNFVFTVSKILPSYWSKTFFRSVNRVINVRLVRGGLVEKVAISDREIVYSLTDDGRDKAQQWHNMLRL